jgi:hypothetical protein
MPATFQLQEVPIDRIAQSPYQIRMAPLREAAGQLSVLVSR